jgi:hypothetical protein
MTGRGEGVWWSRRRFDCRTSRSCSRLRSSSSLLSRSRSGRRCANSGATRDRSACSVLSALPGEPPFFALVCVSVWRSQLGEDEGEAKSRAKGPPPRLHAPSLEQGVHRANLRLSTGYTCPQRCAVRRGGRVAVRRAATGRSDVTGESAPEEPPEPDRPEGAAIEARRRAQRLGDKRADATVAARIRADYEARLTIPQNVEQRPTP